MVKVVMLNKHRSLPLRGFIGDAVGYQVEGEVGGVLTLRPVRWVYATPEDKDRDPGARRPGDLNLEG